MIGWIKNNPTPLVVMSVLVVWIIFLKLVYNAGAAPPPPLKIDFVKFAKELPYCDRPKLIKKAGIVAFQPTKLTLKDVKKEYGNPLQTPHVVIRESDNEEEVALFDRPEVLTLNIYANIVFVQSDFSARPDEIVLIMVKE
jgi:hypothetical protein